MMKKLSILFVVFLLVIGITNVFASSKLCRVLCDEDYPEVKYDDDELYTGSIGSYFYFEARVDSWGTHCAGVADVRVNMGIRVQAEVLYEIDEDEDIYYNCWVPDYCHITMFTAASTEGYGSEGIESIAIIQW